MKLGEEFKKFIFRGNVVDLAIAVVIGGAFGKIVSSFVDDLIMPAISPLMPGGDWRNATLTPLNLKVGHLLGTVLDFVIVAFVLFLVLVKFVGAVSKKVIEDQPAPAPPSTKTCGECLETVPLAAKRCKFCTSTLAALAILLLPLVAQAQVDPKFEYGKPEDVKQVVWTSQIKGGFLVTSGNSVVRNGSLSGTASRKEGDNKFALDAAGAYGETKNRVGVLAPGATTIGPDDIRRNKETSTRNWLVKGRYDRFITKNNAAYLSSSIASDKIAGKQLFGGAQIGYSRQLLENANHLVVSELGYDFQYESYYADKADAVSVHSARVFVGEIWKVSDATGIYGNAEGLFNLNKETNALVASDTAGAKGVKSFKDTRVNLKAGLTTTLRKNLSFGFGFTLRYDQNPAPLANLKGFTFDPGFQPFAEKVDVITEASLIVTLL